jgi:hypothetical protein
MNVVTNGIGSSSYRGVAKGLMIRPRGSWDVSRREAVVGIWVREERMYRGNELPASMTA